MKILLTTLNAKYIHANLALKYLYEAAFDVCPDLEIKEFTINNSRDYLFTELLLGNYDVICFSCYIWNIEQTLDLARDLKKARPDLLLVFGGPEVSTNPEELLRTHRFLDYIMIGEGEKTFRLLCQVLMDGKDDQAVQEIQGIARRRGEEIHISAAAVPISFHRVSFPYQNIPCERDKVIYYESARGCPYNCSYCMSSLDVGIRRLPIERVKEELGYFIHSRVKQVKLLDRTFNWDQARSLEIFKYLKAIDTGETNFHFELCGDLLDDQTLTALSKARKGLFQFEIGIQSVHEETLSAIHRPADTTKALRNIKYLTEMGNSHVHVDLIAGLPFEDYETFRTSFDTVYALSADNLQLGFLKLLRGTEIRDKADEYGYEYMEKAPYEVICNRFISAAELCKLKQIETVLTLYHNRGGFERTIAHLIDRSAFDFYADLAKYFYGGYQHKSHKKEDLYRILHGYISKAEDAEAMKLLEQDLEDTMNFDAVKKFRRKGWTIER